MDRSIVGIFIFVFSAMYIIIKICTLIVFLSASLIGLICMLILFAIL
jgi:hypothetical protein